MSAFERIIGYEEIKLELRRYADILSNPEKYSKLGVKMPSGLMINGDPGLGKTLMAKCFIEASGCKAFMLRKEKPNGEFVIQIKEIFEKAKAESPAIVFLDDMDKFANEDEKHTDAEEYVAVQSCIDECKEFGVFTLATVNNKYCLPESLLRVGRFDKVIEVEVPSAKYAPKIIEYYLQGKKVSEEIDIEAIARLMDGKSCAQLENVINEAGIYAGFEGRYLITQGDIIKAFLRMEFEAPEYIEPRSEEFTRRIAIHEAGHVVISEVLIPGSLTFVTINNRSIKHGGITNYKKMEAVYSKKYAEYIVMRKLGGKAATDIVYGDTDMGCSKDLYGALDKMKKLVKELCAYSFEHSEIFYTDSIIENGEKIMAHEVERLYLQTKKIILDNREFLDSIAAALIEKKMLTFRDIEMIRHSVTIVR